ncbi:hypothetical protein DRO55_06580 [Candidatus Bathyarchaeota archaeon]|nr:MAG: hypothetical protein DRO55_06580 [Candidatus Bathyarchaeota archaeon]
MHKSSNKRLKQTIAAYLLVILLSSMLIALSPVSIVHGKPSADFRVEQVVWGTSSDNQIDVTPGDSDVPLTVYVRNLSNHTIKGIYATLHLDYPFTNTTGGLEAAAVGEAVHPSEALQPVSVEEVPPATSFYMTFRLNIDQDAKAGSYTYPMTIEYLVNQSGIFIVGEPKTLDVTVILPDRAPVIDSFTPIDGNPIVYVGDSLNFSVECHDPDGDPLTYRWILDDRIVSNVSWYLYTPSSDDVGTHTIEFRVSDGNLITSQTWSIQVDRLKDVKVLISDNELTGGLDNQLNITITNNLWKGTVQIRMDIPAQAPLVIYGNDSWVFRSVEPNDSITVTPVIFVPETSIGATYTVTLTASYNDEYGRSHTDTYDIGLIIRGFIRLIVYDINVAPQPASKASTITITATILNKGNIPAKNLNVTIQPNDVLMLSSMSRYYIDQIDPNSPEPISVRAHVKSDVENGTYQVTLTITYVDDAYREQRINITLPLTITESGEGEKPPEGQNLTDLLLSGEGLTIIILAATAIILLILYLRQLAMHRSSTG